MVTADWAEHSKLKGFIDKKKVLLVNLGKCLHIYSVSGISLEASLDRTEKSETRSKNISKHNYNISIHICNLSPQDSLESVKGKILSGGK